MNNFLKGLVAVALSFTLGTAQAAEAPWIDATHLFDAQVKQLAKSVKMETKTDFAKRHRAPAPVAKEYKVGDVETFWTKNIAANKFEQVQATCKAIGTNCIVFLQNGKTVSDKALANVQKTFDEKIYPIDTNTFGQEWKPGIDGDNRITLLLFDVQDGFNGTGGYVGGYFFAGDEFLQSQIPAQYDIKSNEREMFYLDIYPSDPEKETYMAVVAHEFQHMIHFNHDPQEYTWLNESCSQIAMYLCGYGHANQIMSYVQTPDNSLLAWAPENMVANYGEAYLWNYYLMNRYMPTEAARTSFFKKLVDSKTHGAASFEEALKPFKTTFAQAFQDNMMANFINSPKIGNGEFAYDKSLGRLRLPPAATIKTLPGQIQEKVFIWSTDAVKVDLTGAKNTVKVDFAGGNAKLTATQTAQFTVTAVLSDSRDQVVPVVKTIGVKTTADGKMQAGTLEVATEGKFDTLTLLVGVQAPLWVPDPAYAKVPGIPYVVNVSDSGAVVATENTGSASVRRQVEEYAMTAKNLSQAQEAALEQGLTSLDSLTHEITREVKNQSSNGQMEAVRELLSVAQTEANREALKPLAKKVAEQLVAEKAQGTKLSAEADDLIQQLRGL